MESLMSHAKITLTDLECSWISELAARLRLIQSDTAQADAGQRGGYLQEELERSLKNVLPANRKRFIEALLARFPVAGKVALALAPVPALPVVAVPAAAAETPVETLERLLAIIPQLSEEKRDELARRLFNSDFARAFRNQLVMEASEESQRALGLPPGQQPRLKRMEELVILLLDVVSRLDQTALKTMEALSPRSPLVKRSEGIRRVAARFLTGEIDLIEPQVREIFSLLAALLVAPLGGGRAFGQPYVERFSPAAIEDVVTAEGGGGIGGMFGGSKKERCWVRYCDLARDFATADLVDRKIRDCLASVVQKTVEKSGAGGR